VVKNARPRLISVSCSMNALQVLVASSMNVLMRMPSRVQRTPRAAWLDRLRTGG
jgi:hypothetical protein